MRDNIETHIKGKVDRMFPHAIRYEGLTAGMITSHQKLFYEKKKTKYRIKNLVLSNELIKVELPP